MCAAPAFPLGGEDEGTRTMAYLPLMSEASAIFPKQTISVRPDVTIMVSSGTMPEKTQRNTGTTAPVFELSYSRKNALVGEVNHTSVELQPGHAALGFIGEVAGQAEYDNGQDILLYSIWVSPRAFDRFYKDVSGKENVGFHSFQKEAYNFRAFKSDAQDERIMSKLDACFAGGQAPNRLLLEIYVLELLYINIERLSCGSCCKDGRCRLSKTDSENLAYARELLLDRLDAPPSLLELSHMVHMNDCKLKRGFKQCYGKTVYEFIRDQRFDKAFSLLEQGKCNVSETAFALGYTNVSHFSEGFQKRFGILPRMLSKNQNGGGR